MMRVDRLDHLVLTVTNIQQTCDFYTRALGMSVMSLAGGYKGLIFGTQKIVLHEFGKDVEPMPYCPIPGSSSICFTTAIPLADIIQHLAICQVDIVAGPLHRIGALGNIVSVYIRDPDLNIIEIANNMTQCH